MSQHNARVWLVMYELAMEGGVDIKLNDTTLSEAVVMWGTNCAWGWARAGLAALRAATSIVTSSPLTNSCACASLRTKLSHLIWADEGIFQRNTGKRIFAVDIRVSNMRKRSLTQMQCSVLGYSAFYRYEIYSLYVVR